MKSFLLIPLIVLVAAAAGYGVCRAAGWNAYPRPLVSSAIICTVAAMFALVPANVARDGGIAAVSQASLVGSLLHMFLTIVFSAVAWLVKVAGEQKPFLFWLLVFYWVSLVALVAGLVRVIRHVAKKAAAGAAAAPGHT